MVLHGSKMTKCDGELRSTSVGPCTAFDSPPPPESRFLRMCVCASVTECVFRPQVLCVCSVCCSASASPPRQGVTGSPCSTTTARRSPCCSSSSSRSSPSVTSMEVKGLCCASAALQFSFWLFCFLFGQWLHDILFSFQGSKKTWKTCSVIVQTGTGGSCGNSSVLFSSSPSSSSTSSTTSGAGRPPTKHGTKSW